MDFKKNYFKRYHGNNKSTFAKKLEALIFFVASNYSFSLSLDSLISRTNCDDFNLAIVKNCVIIGQKTKFVL